MKGIHKQGDAEAGEEREKIPGGVSRGKYPLKYSKRAKTERSDGTGVIKQFHGRASPQKRKAESQQYAGKGLKMG
jgi:hypothetical protein